VLESATLIDPTMCATEQFAHEAKPDEYAQQHDSADLAHMQQCCRIHLLEVCSASQSKTE
jgi:hypothetical protein